MWEIISPELYGTVFLYAVIIMTLVAGNYVGNTYTQIKNHPNNFIIALLITVIFAVWIGLRPADVAFGDTFTYAHKYYMLQEGNDISMRESEGLWNDLMLFCADRYDVEIFFLIVSIGYFGFTLWACQRITPNNPLVSLLFIFGAFSFFTYGTNGIRNGLGCSIVLVAITYLTGKKIDLIIALLLGFLASRIHNSTLLPMLMGLVSYFCIKSFKWAGLFWLFSIFISLVAGDFIENFFMTLGFDDRMDKYLSGVDENKFSQTDFRWDFLIYSAMPILLGYYIIFEKGVKDKYYELLLNTYTLSNSFWVMIIRASYSNRFAYLSWFMLPIVLAYPVLRLDVWGVNQGSRLRMIMYAQVAFTWVMQTLYW